MTRRQIVIIGAGVSGASIARQLSKKELDILVVERASDVCEGTSKANSGIVHAGFDAHPGSLMAKLNVEGNALMGDLSEELEFPFFRIGFPVKQVDLSVSLRQSGRSNRLCHITFSI